MRRFGLGVLLILLILGGSLASSQRLEILEPTYGEVKGSWDTEMLLGREELVVVPADFLLFNAPLLPAEQSLGYDERTSLVTPGGVVSWQVNLAEPGLYALVLDYLVQDTSILAPEIAVLINGEHPFREARRIILPNIWTQHSSRPNIDGHGYELTPRSVKLVSWRKVAVYDATYLHSEPLLFKLEAGLNTIELRGISGQFLLGKVSVVAPPSKPSYAEYVAQHPRVESLGEVLVKIEAEQMHTRSDSAIRARSERDPSVTPYDSKIHYLNILDGASFSKGGQEVTWQFTVPKSGWYDVAFKYKQATKYDFPVSRQILIDGSVPFGELDNFAFPYTPHWDYGVLADEYGEPYLLFLEEGKHSLTLRVNLDHVRPTVVAITTIMEEINDLTLQIKRLTGNRVDRFRDWNLENYLPDIKVQLLGWADTLEAHYHSLNSLNPQVEEIGEVVNLKIAFNQLRQLAKEPNEIPNRLNQLSQGSSAITQLLGTLLESLTSSPLSLDAIFVYQNQALPPPQASFAVRAQENVRRFLLSFQGEQYGAAQTKATTLQVWVNRSRPFVQLLQQMIDEAFTPQAGIMVQLSLMPDEGKLILARASKGAPDVALGVSNWLPHELAVRGALLDLRQFSGFSETVQSFSSGALIPFAYGEGLYALPETQDFWVLFYRTDLLQALNLPVPHSWDQVIDILPELQRFGMNFATPLATFGGFKPFAGTTPFLYQWGGELYAPDGMSTAIDSEEALEAMRFMTELFTIYNLPQEVPNFYHHFRYGPLPLGIGNFVTYVQLRTAAPEIASSWALAPYPGRILGGQLVRWAPGSGQTAMILDQTAYPDQAWQFLEWWLSAETQIEYAYRLQSLYGETYLWNTANLDAFRQLPWPQDHKQVILEQYAWLREPSKIPGGYMLERELSNIWNKIVFDGENPRTTMDDAVIRINREIARKMEEFGFMEAGQRKIPYQVPTIENIEGWLRAHD